MNSKYSAYTCRTDGSSPPLCREDFPTGPFAAFKVAPTDGPLPTLGQLDVTAVLTTAQAAALLGSSVQVLCHLRMRGLGPNFHKPKGGRSVWYTAGDLIAWRAAKSSNGITLHSMGASSQE